MPFLGRSTVLGHLPEWGDGSRLSAHQILGSWLVCLEFYLNWQSRTVWEVIPVLQSSAAPWIPVSWLVPWWDLSTGQMVNITDALTANLFGWVQCLLDWVMRHVPIEDSLHCSAQSLAQRAVPSTHNHNKQTIFRFSVCLQFKLVIFICTPLESFPLLLA